MRLMRNYDADTDECATMKSERGICDEIGTRYQGTKCSKEAIS